MHAFLFLDSFREERENFEDIAYDTIVADFEDRSIFVFVDGDDAVRTSHACQVLDSTGNSACNVDFRTNCFTSLANLMESIDPASVNSCTGCTNSAAEDVCAFFLRIPVLNGSSLFMPTAASNDNVSVFDFNAFAAQFDEFDEFGHEVSIGEVSFLSITSPVAEGSASGFLKTCGRTVPICGRLSGQMISAMMLPPRAGRVHTMVFLSSSTPSCVQPAVRPVFKELATRGPRSRPMFVAPTRNTFGFSSWKKSQITFA